MELLKMEQNNFSWVRIIKQDNLYIVQRANNHPNGYSRIVYELKTLNKNSALNAYKREKERI